MAIPDAGWAALDPATKRERILDAARELFAREGVDAPMPALASAVGVGVGSVYRCFPSKQDLIAALVVAIYPATIEYTGMLMTEPLAATLLAGGVAAGQEVIVPPDAGANVKVALRSRQIL